MSGMSATKRDATLALARLDMALEETEGALWSLALREGRRLRERAAEGFGYDFPALRVEILSGCPVGWWNRP